MVIILQVRPDCRPAPRRQSAGQLASGIWAHKQADFDLGILGGNCRFGATLLLKAEHQLVGGQIILRTAASYAIGHSATPPDEKC